MNVTALMLTPTIATLIDPIEVPSVKRLMMGGEMMTTAARNTWLPYVELSNAYGPTEAAVAILANPRLDEQTVCRNIGKPIGSNRIYLIGLDNLPVPSGIVAELCVAGPQLARGYLNQFELTEKSFILNSLISEERIYCTGDLACLNQDGIIEIIGRKDNQIKINGFRIELDEIQHVLHSHSKVARVCVLALSTDISANHKILAVFITFKGICYESQQADELNYLNSEIASFYTEEVKTLAIKRLPVYMVPNVWIPLNRMPHNSSDKVDVRTLTTLFERMDSQLLSRHLHSSAQKHIIQPQTQDEVLIQELWSEVLRIPQANIGINHSFRYLGGDSILAIQVASACRKQNLNISVHSMLNDHTIQQLAGSLRVNVSKKSKDDQRVGGVIHLSPNQHRYLEFEQDNFNHFNQSWLFNLRDPIGAENLTAAIQQLIESHDILRARFSRNGKQWQIRVLLPEEVSFEVKHSQVQSLEELKARIYHLQASLDLISGPLFQFSLYDTLDGQHFIFMTVHHFIVDLLSWGTLLEDLELLLQGQECTPKSVSYMMWNQALYDHAQTLDLSSWPQQPATQPIITNSKLLAKNTHETTRVLSFQLNAYITKLAERYCGQSTSVEMVDLLISSLVYSYCSTFERDSLSVTLESHGRQFGDGDMDISRTVGWLTNLYPIVIRVGRNASIMDAIRQVVSQQQHIRGKELAYGLLSYLNKNTAPFFEKPPPQVTLGYMPNSVTVDCSGSYFLPIPSDSKYKFDLGGVSPKWRRHQVFGCGAHFVGEQLEVTIAYSDAMYSKSQLQGWMNSWETALVDVIMSISRETVPVPNEGLLLDNSPIEKDLPSPSQLNEKTSVDSNNGIEDDCLTLISKTSRETMFIVHCATGVASYFELLRKYMRCTLYSINDPTLGTHNSFDSIETLATRYLKAILKVQPAGPYYLHGYSFGGLIAFEIARQLEFRGHEVVRLTIIDTLAPHTGRLLKDHTDSHSSLKYFDLISASGGWNLDEAASRMILDKIDENIQLMRNYQPPIQKLATSIVLVKSLTTVDQAGHQYTCYGWSEYSSRVDIHNIEAEHHQLMFEPYVSKVAEYLQRDLVAHL
ncbi:hypothetical protein K7432_000290 [Basidiobolus ranarum]|uniref:Carrier domain-containing protein n=1 Tax=Basidiobolus ranarum TaxID=34480 RepID=A0ABR2WBG9_9FUNG